MPIFIFLSEKPEPIVARGESLGRKRRIQMAARLPLEFQSMASEDMFVVPSRAIAYVQSFTDAELQRRQVSRAEQQKLEARRNPNPGTEPKRVTPKGKP